MELQAESRPSQAISNVSTHGGFAVVGHARDVYFPNAIDPKEKQESEIRNCRNTLFLTNPEIDRAGLVSTKGKRAPGTCEWIKENETYQSWLRQKEHLLWISGGPGKGKTIMSIYLTEELERYTRESQDTNIIYYFCTSEDEKRNNASAVLRGLLWSITRIYPQLTKEILENFESPEKGQNTLASPETLWSMLHAILRQQGLGQMYCVLDGLDECDEVSRTWLTVKLVDLLSHHNQTGAVPSFNLVMVSRHIAGLEKVPQIKLDPDNDGEVRRDIQKFVSIRVEELSQEKNIKSDFRQFIERSLLERADGTFLWVGLVIVELRKKRTLIEIEETLKSIPRGLPDMYRGMLRQIGRAHRAKCIDMLSWVTFAFRPLSLHELADAIGIHASDQVSKEDALYDLITLAGPIIKVDKNIVGLVHQSARDYLLLLPPIRTNYIDVDFHIRPAEAHLHLAHRCIDALGRDSVWDKSKRPGAYDMIRLSPFETYASEFWPDHAARSSELAVQLLKHPSGFFKHDAKARGKWWQHYVQQNSPIASPLAPSEAAEPKNLHLACYFDIRPWIGQYTKKRAWERYFSNPLNEKDAEGMTPIVYAVQEKQEAIVRLLLDRGASVNARDMRKVTPLHRTVFRNDNGNIIRLLVDWGASLNAKDEDGQTPLNWGVICRNFAMVSLLVDLGAEINVKDNYGQTPLHSAVFHYHKDTLSFLLNHGAKVNAKDTLGATPLHDAASRNQSAAAQQLLEYGAKINIRDERGRTPLDVAIQQDSDDVARLLRQHDANSSARYKEQDIQSDNTN